MKNEENNPPVPDFDNEVIRIFNPERGHSDHKPFGNENKILNPLMEKDPVKYNEISKSVEFMFISKNMENVVRFSNRSKIKNQTVAEHTSYVAIISYLIAKMEEKYNGAKINYEKLMGYSLFHDVPEAFSGDVVRDFKKKIENFESIYDRTCQLIINEITKDNPLNGCIERNCFGMGDESIEGQIVAAADILDPFIYIIQEKKLGNTNMKDIYNNIIKILDNSKFETVKIIGELIANHEHN